jgi:hypothetical protein
MLIRVTSAVWRSRCALSVGVAVADEDADSLVDGTDGRPPDSLAASQRTGIRPQWTGLMAGPSPPHRFLLASQLQAALSNRAVIERAIGMVDDIHNLFSDLAVPDGFTEQPVELEKLLTALTEAAKSGARSYRGLALTLIIDKQPVSLTSAEVGNTSDIATSLRLWLAWIPSLGAGSRITFYASTPGTFVDLAADLAFVLGSESLRLDEDIPWGDSLTALTALTVLVSAVGAVGAVPARVLPLTANQHRRTKYQDQK